MTERRIGWRDWALVLVTLAIWVAMLAVGIVDVRQAQSQVTIPGAAKGQVKVPLHAHTDIGNGGKIKFRDLDFSSTDPTPSIGSCDVPCLGSANQYTSVGVNGFGGGIASSLSDYTVPLHVLSRMTIDAGTQIYNQSYNNGAPAALQINADPWSTWPALTVVGGALSDTVFRITKDGAAEVAPESDVVPLTVTQIFGGTVDMTKWVDGSGNVAAKIDAAGKAHFGDNALTGTNGQPLALYNGYADDASSPDVTFDVSALSADRVITFPDAGGGVVLGGVTNTLDLSTASVMRSSTASTGANFEDNSTTTKKLRMVLSGGTGNNSFTFTNATRAMNFGFRDLSGSVVTVGDDPPSVAAGNLGKVDLTAQTANITTTNLSNSPTAGLYRVEVYLLTTTADVTAGTLAVTIGWTDGAGATTDATSIAAHSLAATGRSKASYLIQLASGDITYAVTNTGGYGTSQYAVYVRVVSLG